MNGLEPLFYNWMCRRKGIPKGVYETHHRWSVLGFVWCVGTWYAGHIEHTSWGFPKEMPKFESTLNPEPNKNSHWFFPQAEFLETYVAMI